jgi:hypothetical protein
MCVAALQWILMLGALIALAPLRPFPREHIVTVTLRHAAQSVVRVESGFPWQLSWWTLSNATSFEAEPQCNLELSFAWEKNADIDASLFDVLGGWFVKWWWASVPCTWPRVVHFGATGELSLQGDCSNSITIRAQRHSVSLGGLLLWLASASCCIYPLVSTLSRLPSKSRYSTPVPVSLHASSE